MLKPEEMNVLQSRIHKALVDSRWWPVSDTDTLDDMTKRVYTSISEITNGIEDILLNGRDSDSKVKSLSFLHNSLIKGSDEDYNEVLSSLSSHNKLTAQVEVKANLLSKYCEAMNKIDDYFEYASESEKDREKVHSIMAELITRIGEDDDNI